MLIYFSVGCSSDCLSLFNLVVFLEWMMHALNWFWQCHLVTILGGYYSRLVQSRSCWWKTAPLGILIPAICVSSISWYCLLWSFYSIILVFCTHPCGGNLGTWSLGRQKLSGWWHGRGLWLRNQLWNTIVWAGINNAYHGRENAHQGNVKVGILLIGWGKWRQMIGWLLAPVSL